MPTLEQIAETGIFSKGLDGSLQRQFVPFNEQLTAEYFADEINRGRLSIKDAYKYFWSYVISINLSKQPMNEEWIALRNDWENPLLYIVSYLKPEKVEEFVNITSKTYFAHADEFRDVTNWHQHYQPVLEDFWLISQIVHEHLTLRNSGLDNYFFCVMLWFSSQYEKEDSADLDPMFCYIWNKVYTKNLHKSLKCQH